MYIYGEDKDAETKSVRLYDLKNCWMKEHDKFAGEKRSMSMYRLLTWGITTSSIELTG